MGQLSGYVAGPAIRSFMEMNLVDGSCLYNGTGNLTGHDVMRQRGVVVAVPTGHIAPIHEAHLHHNVDQGGSVTVGDQDHTFRCASLGVISHLDAMIIFPNNELRGPSRRLRVVRLLLLYVSVHIQNMACIPRKTTLRRATGRDGRVCPCGTPNTNGPPESTGHCCRQPAMPSETLPKGYEHVIDFVLAVLLLRGATGTQDANSAAMRDGSNVAVATPSLEAPAKSGGAYDADWWRYNCPRDVGVTHFAMARSAG